ncbi:hypothetical protein JNUCC0626_14140 [Lentzea sp. JNUCC 0626]|uniref:hypothetical protein n=1 Tax=Lentzea sp. JNUCC 0626 TaxID=3367513 RepID=UPI0037480F02
MINGVVVVDQVALCAVLITVGGVCGCLVGELDHTLLLPFELSIDRPEGWIRRVR